MTEQGRAGQGRTEQYKGQRIAQRYPLYAKVVMDCETGPGHSKLHDTVNMVGGGQCRAKDSGI